jgi:hypothetical protein
MLCDWLDPCGFHLVRPISDEWGWKRLEEEGSECGKYGYPIALAVTLGFWVGALVFDIVRLKQQGRDVGSLREQFAEVFRNNNVTFSDEAFDGTRFFQPWFLVFTICIRAIVGFLGIPFLTMFYFIAGIRALKPPEGSKRSFRRLVFWIIAVLILWVGGASLGGGFRDHYRIDILNEDILSMPSELRVVTTSPPATICESRIYGASVWELSVLPMLAQTDESVMPSLVRFLNARVPELEIGNWTRIEFPNDETFPMILSSRKESVFAAFSGCRNDFDLSVLVGSGIWAIFRKILFSYLIPFWDQVWAPLLDPFLRLFDEYLLVFITGPRRVVMRYRMVGDWAIEFANQFYNDTKIPHILIGHGPSGLLVKAYVAHTASEGVPQWDGVTFDAPYYQHSPITELQHRSERKGYFIRNYVSGINMLTMGDPIIGADIKLPTVHAARFSDPYETFCVLSAACISTDALDDFCSQRLQSASTYKSFFEEWDRVRDF